MVVKKIGGEKEKMDILKIGFAIAVIALAVFACGCVDSPHPTQVPTVTSEPTFGRSTQIPQPERNDNAIFAQLVKEMTNDLGRYLDDLSTSMTDVNLIEAHTAAVRLESLADVYIEEINECVVIGDMITAKKLVLQALEEVRLGAIDFQAGLPRNGQMEEVDMDKLYEGQAHHVAAGGYFDKVIEHCKEV